MTDADPRIADHYDDLAPHWADIADSPHRTDLIYPVFDDVLPALDGSHVLDAGCGAGVYAERLVARGADVTGVDASPEMLAAARERVPEATFHRADLTEGLDSLADGCVDAVVCQHVFSHLPDLRPVLDEFARVLHPGGTLAVSTHNPVHDYVVVRDGDHHSTGDASALDPVIETGAAAPTYDETERFDIRFESADASERATYYRRPVESLLSPLLEAGFTLETVVEPSFDRAERDAPDADDSRDYPPETLCLGATL